MIMTIHDFQKKKGRGYLTSPLPFTGHPLHQYGWLKRDEGIVESKDAYSDYYLKTFTNG
jgi:hypothetical protein